MSKSIIIVDDDRDLRNMLQLYLEQAGYTAHVASNGLRLIGALRVDRPDLILLDVVMSWIDGFELCQALKQNPDFASIPIFFISGKTSAEDIARGYQYGCMEYLTKPLDLQVLVQRIRQVIGDP